MGLIPPHSDIGLQGPLDQVGGCQVRDPLAADQPLIDGALRHHKAHSQAGHEHFGKCAGIDDSPAGIECLECRLGASLVAKIAHKVILQDGYVVPICQPDQPAPPLADHAGAGGVVKVGDGIDELGVVLLQQWLQCLDLHAVLVGWDGHDGEAEGTEQIQASTVGRVLYQDDIAVLEEELSGQR